MNDIERQKRIKLKNDFPFYAKNCLKIRTKEKGIQPFLLNTAQKYVHKKIEEQKEKTGKVRAVVLKGRQQGISTYIEGRFTHKTTHHKGRQAYILTHEESASQNLFSMSKRYYDNLPQQVKPATSASNAKELYFCDLDSGYQVGTAGNKSVGRSQTNHFFHGSEVAFWPNAGEHAKGILQTIPDADGTEVVYESTANGVNNFFHLQWKLAERGESDFIAIFVPWFWDEGYSKELAEGFILTEPERELVGLYGLTLEQINWRRNKINELSSDGTNGEKAFKQEYPCNAAEAFQLSGSDDSLITAENILRARKNKVKGSGSLIIGVDPSRGGDRFSIISRQGRKAYNPISYVGDQVNTMGKAVSKLVPILENICPIAGKKPDMMFVDAGCGAEIVDRLHELGHKNVKAIAFGSSPKNSEKYINKRGEMWGDMNLWLNDEHLSVELPDNDEIQADLNASPYDRDSHDRIVLWRKEKIKKAFGFSPDSGDSLCLTFAEPVTKEAKIDYGDMPTGGWMGA